MKIQSINPTTEQVMKEFEILTLNQSLKEIEKSKQAFVSWRRLQIERRIQYIKTLSKILLKKKRQLAEIMTNEMGKPISQAISEVEKCAWVCDYYAQNAKKFLAAEKIKTEAKKSYLVYEPLGVILGIMPWNFPFWQVFRFAVSTLAAGNIVIIKHASNVPQCALAIQKVFEEAGFPKNVFKTLVIDADTALQIIQKDSVQGVSLTGSVEAGQKVAEVAGKRIIKTVLELGGNDPFIVLNDAYIFVACEAAVKARTINSGQSCIAAKRFIIAGKIAKRFIDEFIKNTQALTIGDPLNYKTQIGPLARRDLMEKVDAQVHDAIKKGAKILCGGKKLEGRGYFYAPTVITSVNESMRIYNEEVFGPVAIMLIVNNEKEAIKKANSTEFGLAASIWTKDIKKAENLAKQLQVGTVFINGIVHSDPRLPFGGAKKSGIGRELGHIGIKEFTNAKTIVVE